MLRCGKWEMVDVRLCGSGPPQSTTAKRGHFVGYHGEGVTQSVPPNLAAELGRRWMFAISVGHCKGWCFFECCISSQVVGKGEGVLRCKPPNLRALRKFLQKLSKVTNYGIMQISILLRAWFVHRPFHKQKPQPNCSIEVFVGGRRWIRTTEVVDNRFTVCSLWPLGNPPMELVNGIEPSTC